MQVEPVGGSETTHPGAGNSDPESIVTESARAGTDGHDHGLDLTNHYHLDEVDDETGDLDSVDGEGGCSGSEEYEGILWTKTHTARLF